jgi:hypothetical protein
MKIFIQNINEPVYAQLALKYSQTAKENADAESEAAPEYYQVIGSSSDPLFTKPKHIQALVNVSVKYP